MVDLLERYSATDILIFLAFFALAAKEFIGIVDLIKKKIKEMSTEEILNEKEKEILDGYDGLIKENKEKIKYLEDRIGGLNLKAKELEDNMPDFSKRIKLLEENFKGLDAKIDLLIISDMDNIKAYITEKHHYYCYVKGWIDDYTLECCENRYQHYKSEGGKPFIDRLMEELRALPKSPPQIKNEEV